MSALDDNQDIIKELEKESKKSERIALGLRLLEEIYLFHKDKFPNEPPISTPWENGKGVYVTWSIRSRLNEYFGYEVGGA